MHSMLRQNQVRSQDVKPYIRAFTRNNPLDLGEWAKEEGSLFEPGTLIFLLEPAKKPPGMTSFARGQQGTTEVTQDAYRVKDMCVVVDKVDGKCWVLAISPSAFELRFVDTLFREKAQKSFLEGLDFNYLSAQPRPNLTPEKLKELRQLSTLYSKSGSRRTMAQDESGPEEPAKAMLAFLGADLGPKDAKQVMELGLICNLIFAPESEQENKTQSIVKGCFSPILSTDKLKGQTLTPPPTTAMVVENRELINEEVSLLTQSYLANEAQEAEDYIKYSPPAGAATDPSQNSGVWTSSPAAAQDASGDEFKPLTAPPRSFNLGGFPSPQSSGSQPSLSLSPDIPSILTGEHQVISINQKLAPQEDTNGHSETKVPSMPAWYLTTHDINEMNQVALRRAQEAPYMPDGLAKLESELSYDALPVVDARFRAGEAGAPPAQEFTASPVAPPATYSEQFSVDIASGEAGLPPSSKLDASQIDASGNWPGGVASGVSGVQGEKDFVDSIFENSGSKGTIEFNADTPAPPADPLKRRAKDWQPVSEPAAGPASGFVSPGSLAVPPPPPANPTKDANLFERLSGQGQQPAEEATTHAWADGARGGVPTNLKDMLTADSAVFSTSGSGMFPDLPMPGSETPPQAIPTTEPPSGFSMGADSSPFARPPATPPSGTASSAVDDGAPAPWMNLPHHSPPAAEVSAEPPAETVSQGSTAAENYNELATALTGLMDSTEATEASDASAAVDFASPSQLASSAEPQATLPETDLFGDALDKAIDLASSTPEPESQPESEQHDDYRDNRDMTMDLNTALLQKMATGPATLSSPTTEPEEVEPERDAAVVLPPVTIPTFDTPSLVSPAMAAHAQSMTEPAAEQTAEPTMVTDSPSLGSTAEPPTPDVAQSSLTELTPIRPARSRYRRGVPPRVTPDESIAPPAPEPIETSQAAVETSADLDKGTPEPAPSSAQTGSDPSTDLFGASMSVSEPATDLFGASSPSVSEPANDSFSAASPFASEPANDLFSATSPFASEPATDLFGATSPSVSEPATDLFGATIQPPAEPATATEPSPPAVSDSSTDLFGEVSEPSQPVSDPAVYKADSGYAASSASATDAFFSSPEPTPSEATSSYMPQVDQPETLFAGVSASASAAAASTPVSQEPASAKDDEIIPSEFFPASVSQDTTPVTPPQVELPTVSFEDSGVFLSEKEIDGKPMPYGLDLKPLTASGMQRSQPSVEPKLVISESTRFMARLNQRLSEADKKLSSRCDQSRDRLNRELDALLDDARKVERQNELSTGTLTEQLVQHLETVSEEVKASISKTSSEARDEIQQLIKQAEDNVMQMHKDMLNELEQTESDFQVDTNSMSESTRANLNDHAQNRLTDFNKKLEEITTGLEGAYTHHVNVLLARYGKFEARLNEEVDAIVSSLDRNVSSMTVEIDGSWDRASEKLTASQSEFGNSVNYLVHSCRADIKQVHLDLYAKQVLPRLLENKDIFRSMLLDMKRNFEEQSEKVRKKQLSGLTGSIDGAKSQLNTLTKECLSTIESVGKGQQFGLEDLFKNTNARLEEIITTVESRLKTAKQQIVDNDEACMKTSESSRVEDEPAFSKEKQQAIAALNECRTKADNALETHISSSCLDLEQLSETMQEDLAKQRQDWTAQVRGSADESLMQVKQALQDAFQAIETAKEKHME